MDLVSAQAHKLSHFPLTLDSLRAGLLVTGSRGKRKGDGAGEALSRFPGPTSEPARRLRSDRISLYGSFLLGKK